MRTRPSVALLTLAVVWLSGGAAQAQKLDKDDKKFLDEVRPLMLRDEENTYKKLGDKADRLEFQKIFWARRDPELATPENEYQPQYLKDRAFADQTYNVAGRMGSLTDCGRTYILLGKPNDIEQHGDNTALGSRVPETWTYRGPKFENGKFPVSFEADCAGVSVMTDFFDRAALAKVLHPGIDYRFDKDRHLVKLTELLPRDTQARALFKQARQDFPVAARVFYLKVADGGTAVVGLLRGQPAAAAAAAGGGTASRQVSIAASALGEDGAEVGWTEQTMAAPVAADGSFLGSFKLGLKPGKYTVKVGAVELASGKGALTSLPIEVPDLSRVSTGPDGVSHPVPSAASLILVQKVEDLPPESPVDQAHPFAAFSLGPLLLRPFFDTTLHKSDEISIFYQVYDLTLNAAGTADAVANLAISRAGRSVAQTETPIQTAIGGSILGPVPLASYEPGKYAVRLRVSDRLGKQEVVQEATFEVAP